MKAISQSELFKRHVRGIIDECAKQNSPRRAAELTAFSILVSIDGEAIECGPYALRPIDRNGKEGRDIAGTLHHELNGS